MFMGDKAKLITLLDNERADRTSLIPQYSIDITVGKSPKLGVKCGGITLFRANKIAEDFESKLQPKDLTPKGLERAKLAAAEMADDLNTQTDVQCEAPILFKETDGRWLPWAVNHSLVMYDRLGGSAKITLKCPMLRIRVMRMPLEIAALRSNPGLLFPVLNDIDQLLSRGYRHDPWSNVVRRGRIGADMAKR